MRTCLLYILIQKQTNAIRPQPSLPRDNDKEPQNRSNNNPRAGGVDFADIDDGRTYSISGHSDVGDAGEDSDVVDDLLEDIEATPNSTPRMSLPNTPAGMLLRFTLVNTYRKALQKLSCFFFFLSFHESLFINFVIQGFPMGKF